MLERAAIALLIIAAGLLAYRAFQWISLRRSQRSGLELEGYLPGGPAILYFTAPRCGPCVAIQEPALEELAVQAGDSLQIIKVDANQRPELADAWGVLSVPTTFIIDSQGRPRRVNHGAVRAPHLRRQLADIGESLPEPEVGEQLYNGEIQPEVEA